MLKSHVHDGAVCVVPWDGDNVCCPTLELVFLGQDKTGITMLTGPGVSTQRPKIIEVTLKLIEQDP